MPLPSRTSSDGRFISSAFLNPNIADNTERGPLPCGEKKALRPNKGKSEDRGARRIWIDLDNSPHVPLFKPIVDELEGRGYSVMLTARDCFQVPDLVRLLNLKCTRVGRHYGKNKLLKLAGTCLRALQMSPVVMRHTPDLALSHGSRAQLLLSAVLRIPSVIMLDYEYATGWFLIRPSWALAPEVIPDGSIKLDKRRILKYPGIKEDVYIPAFRPNPQFRKSLDLREEEILVTLRPPATEAHYHNPESEELFDAAIEHIAPTENLRMVVLPRNERQASSIRNRWSSLCSIRKMIIPKEALHGLDLMWHSDLVVSGGGTMNREAAALGVPVYSIFRGRIGAVDRYLADSGRLVLIGSVDEVSRKLSLVRRFRPHVPDGAPSPALQKIIADIVAIAGH